MELADPSGEVQMLRRDVPLPLVLGGEGGSAAGEREDADEGSGVGGCVVALESGCVFEGRVVAGLALVLLAFGAFGCLGRSGAFGGRRDLGGGSGALSGAGGLGRVLVVLVLFGDDDIAVDVTFGVCIGVGQNVVINVDSAVLWRAFRLDGRPESFVT